MTTRTAAPAVRWRAPKPDGIAHAYPVRGRFAAECGAANQDERFDWPIVRHCGACDAELDRKAAA
jgi:hypothetical protein